MFASIAVVAGILIAVVVPTQTRDSRPQPPTGTGVIAGRVVTIDEPALPVRRALVTIAGVTKEIAVVTDDDGRFVVSGLPAGRYTVAATKPGWMRGSHGAVKPGRQGTAIALAAGQRETDVTIRMAKGGVVTGAVTDHDGKPMQGITVRLMQFRMQEGVRLLGAVNAATATDLTDDRGEFRLFGLSPGEYAVAAIPPDDGGPAAKSPAGGTVAHVPVYYPGTTMAVDARTIAVHSGGETTGINLRMQYVRTSRIEGAVLGSESLALQDLQLSLRAAAPPPQASSGSSTSMATALRQLVMLRPDRTFSYVGLAPGRYTLLVRGIQRQTPTPGASYISTVSGVTTMWAMSEINVDGNDIAGLVLTMQPPMTVSGRVRLERATANAPPVDLTRVRVAVEPAGPRIDGGLYFAAPATNAAANGDFILKGVLPGRYRIYATMDGNFANGWEVKTSLASGRDTLDFPLEVQPNVNVAQVDITLTELSQRISGTLQDASGRPASSFTMVLFPADRAYWAVGRRLRTAKPGQDGRYTINDLPIGDYRIAAVEDLNPGDQHDPAFLEQLLPASIPISLKSGERKVQDLRIR